MPTTLCAIHQEEMQEKQGKFGSFWSHRTDDAQFPNGWCNGRYPGGPYKAPITHQTQNPAPTATKPSNGDNEPDWDKIAVGKVASNIVTALVERGIALSDIEKQLDGIFDLSQKIVKYKPDLPF